MLNTALKEYGVTEVAGVKNNPRILEYAKLCGATWVKDDETSWCGIFMGFCAKQSGYEMPKNPETARKWLTVGEHITAPDLGDIAVFWRISPNSWTGHVGIVLRKDGATLWILGGNQTNKVMAAPFSDSQLLGYRRLRRITGGPIA